MAEVPSVTLVKAHVDRSPALTVQACPQLKCPTPQIRSDVTRPHPNTSCGEIFEEFPNRLSSARSSLLDLPQPSICGKFGYI